MYNAAAKAAFLYPKITPKGCIHAVQVDSDINFFIKNSLFTISIHAAHAGSDVDIESDTSSLAIFQSTQPMRAATSKRSFASRRSFISIHAAQVGRSQRGALRGRRDDYFNPRCPSGQRRFSKVPLSHIDAISIHAAQVGSDGLSQNMVWRCCYFNPRCPSGQRLQADNALLTAGGHFNPRCPSGQRRGVKFSKISIDPISIHAARVGSDLVAYFITWIKGDFNPRCPCGQRPKVSAHEYFLVQFQSTLPVWAATKFGDGSVIKHDRFQSTLPVWAATLFVALYYRLFVRFQSTLPVWAATIANSVFVGSPVISIHAARVGSDSICTSHLTSNKNFNPRCPCGQRLNHSLHINQ